MADLHADRAHATWSASASERLWACPGSLALSTLATGVDRESFAAAWGTACHQVSEKCLRDGGDAIRFLDTVEKTKEFEILVDEEMCETAQEYIDYVREKSEGKKLLIEQAFSLADIDPPFDAGGTGDTVILDVPNHHIEIVDLKGGRGIVVEAQGNKQLRTYGLGAVLANPGQWETVTVTIVQPRAPHKDGRIRSETFDIIDLMEWTWDLKEAMHRAAQALADLGKPGDFAAAHLNAGDHCTFCKTKVGCPALSQKSLEIAHAHFGDETGNMKEPPAPDTLSMEQIVRVLDHADMIQGWLNAVRAYAQDQAELGLDVAFGDSAYVLTPKSARRKWTLDDEELVAELAERTAKPAGDFLAAPKPLSPAQVEKLLGRPVAKVAMHDLVDATSSGFNLVRSDKTTREAVDALPKQFFNIEKE